MKTDKPEAGKSSTRMYAQSELLKRGWTAKLIQLFAPEPDAIRKNPFFAKAAPMKLYAPDRIHEIEGSDLFIEAFEKARRRKAGAAKAAATKRSALLDLVSRIEIHIDDDSNIRQNAIDSYNDFHIMLDHDDYEPATTTSDPRFLQRIMVNYARHNLTRYDDHINELYRKVGKAEAYRLLKKKTLIGVGKRYPSLREECRRQIEEIGKK